MGHLTLQAEGLVAGYGSHQVLTDAAIAIRPSSRLAILGANGSGKTTLLKCLSGAIRPWSGHILLDGTPLTFNRAGLTAHRQQVQLVLQDPNDQLFSADVGRDVSFGPMNLGLTTAEVTERVEEALRLLGITDLAARPTHQLSHGQGKRVAIAGAVAMRPCVLLLDEPTAGLDPLGVEEMLAALSRLEAHGTTVVLSTHDVDLALAWAGEVALVHNGRVEHGDPVELLNDPALLTRSRLRRPWVLEVIYRLGHRPTDPIPRDVVALVEHLAQTGRTPADGSG